MKLFEGETKAQGGGRALLGTLMLALLVTACGDDVDGTGERDAAADSAQGAVDAALDSAQADAALDGGPSDAASDGGGLDTGPSPDGSADAPSGFPAVDVRFTGQFPIKAFVLANSLVVLLERPLHLTTEQGRPMRSIRWIDAKGTILRSRGSSGKRHLVDATVHPSGEATLLFAAREGYSFERTNDRGELLGTFELVDPDVSTDPPQSPGAAPIEPFTYDAGRVASLGQDVIAATRTGRHSVITYRLSYDGGDRFTSHFRVLTIPPFSLSPIGLTGGTYDTFRLVDAQFLVHLAVGPEGTIYVGSRYPDVSPRNLPRAFKEAFGETLTGDPDAADSYVVRISPDGKRLGTSVVGTPEPDDLQGLRAITGAVLVPGRKEYWNAQGTGFEVLLGRVDGQTGAVDIRELDVDRGDVAFDVAPIPGSDAVLIAGASGYAQNPNGASITEASNSFARQWTATGASTPVALPPGPRHNEARMITPMGDGRFLIGGMLDGPGTHSADGDLTLLRANGYLVTTGTAARTGM